MATGAMQGATVRSVERALSVLQAMNRQPVSSVDYLHASTGLPKPTLVRLLRTMIQGGYVTNDSRQAGYQLTSLVTSLSCGFQGDPVVVEAGRAWAVRLTRQVKWPVSIAVLDRDAMVVRLSTASESPMSPFHSTINMRLSLFSRAIGRAYLAYCSDAQRATLIERCAGGDDRENALAHRPEALHDLIRAIRRSGYATRDGSVMPTTSNTIAMPLLHEGEVLGSIGMTYFVSALRSRGSLQACIDCLRETRREIEIEVARLARTSARPFRPLMPERQAPAGTSA